MGVDAEKRHRERAAVGDINESQIVITLRSDEISAVEMWPLAVAVCSPLWRQASRTKELVFIEGSLILRYSLQPKGFIRLRYAL